MPIPRAVSKTRKVAGVTTKRRPSAADGMRLCSETWFDDECILIAPAATVTDYSVFAERDVTRVKLSALARSPNKKNTAPVFVKDDEEGNVYISNNDL